MSRPLTLFLSAGEASGDVHGANLMVALKAIRPDIKFVGIGGPRMIREGLECFQNAEELCVVGLVEVLKRLPFFMRSLKALDAKMGEQHIDAYIPIDFPDFNLRLGQKAKARGIKVIYYICPQVWAWRKGRIPKIENLVDRLLTIFPFEAQHFDPKRLDCQFVGHPLCDEVPARDNEVMPLKGEGRLALMPGSRGSELSFHLPTCAAFIKEFLTRYSNVEVHIPCAETIAPDRLRRELGVDDPRVIIHDPGLSNEVLSNCDAALIASGTSTLQAAIINTPFALFYKLNGLTYQIGKRLIKLPYVGLANLVVDRAITRELLQHDMTAENLLAEAEALMWNQQYRQELYAGLKEVRQNLGGPGASARAAEAVLEAVS